MSRIVRFLPLAILGLLLTGLVWRLAVPDDIRVQSRLAGQQVPAFDAPPMVAGKPGLSARDLASGQPRLLNIFASWCVPCIAEARVLSDLQRRGVVIDGLAIRDTGDDVAAFLKDHDDPYARIGADPQSRIQIALGSSGVPESFVVDGRGIIRYQHIGPIKEADTPEILKQLEAAK